MSGIDISNAIRSAAAHERAAGGHENKYSEQMKAAGANMYAAFKLAIAAAPEYHGRKIDEKAIERIYVSTKPRPWWDEHLTAAKFVDGKERADRDRALRLIHWHLDPEAARTRQAQGRIQQAAAQKRLRQQRTSASRGMTSRRKHATDEEHSDRITEENTRTAVAGRELPKIEQAQRTTREDVLGELNRLRAAVDKVRVDYYDAVLLIVRDAAREVEGYVA